MRFDPLMAAAALVLAAACPAAAEVLATGDVNHAGVKAEVTECKRSDGVLTLKVRLTNTTGQLQTVDVVSQRNYDDHYLTANKKKYLPMRDAAKKPLAAAADGFGNLRVRLEKGEMWTWWVKFPAPPADVKKVEYSWPVGSPIDNIPCTDA